jgi:hypothetical protein
MRLVKLVAPEYLVEIEFTALIVNKFTDYNTFTNTRDCIRNY